MEHVKRYLEVVVPENTNIPFFLAKASHFVSVLSTGIFFSRGSLVVGRGRFTHTLLSTIVVGRVKIALKRSCVLSLVKS